jgi:hypothetical protein
VRPQRRIYLDTKVEQSVEHFRIPGRHRGFEWCQTCFHVEQQPWSYRVRDSRICAILNEASDLGFIAGSGSLGQVERLVRPHRVAIDNRERKSDCRRGSQCATRRRQTNGKRS